jgi:large subunit ribosomal protein L6
MSRIGKKIIHIPKDVSLTLEKEKIIAKGKHGTLERSFNNFINLEQEGQTLQVKRLNESKEARSYHGLMRALIQNMILGVNELFTKVLVAEGVGYKFQAGVNENDKALVLSMGYSHQIRFAIPSDLKILFESPTKITISGIDKEQVGFLAAKIRAVRPPEPYKGKGIKYENEKIRRKAGKSGK